MIKSIYAFNLTPNGSCQVVFYRKLLKNEEAAKELDELFEKVDKIEVHHIYSVDYFRENGPKNTENYTSPQDFVNKLQDKVNTVVEQVSKKYSS